MLTGDLVRARVVKDRVIPLYLDRARPHWLEAAETLLALYREGIGRTRAWIEEEIDALYGSGGKASLVYRGLAKVIDDRAEFEVVSQAPPEQIRECVFTAAAAERRAILAHTGVGPRRGFDREKVLREAALALELEPEAVVAGLFADLRDENRLLRFEDATAEQIIDRYNVALAQAILLRSVRIELEIRRERPARYRQIFRWLKFHRLIHQVEGTVSEGYTIRIDGPLSLFSATTKYGLQVALFLPAVLLCQNYRLVAELRHGPKREPRAFELSPGDGLVSPMGDYGVYVPEEMKAFAERFRQVAPAWEIRETTVIHELGREGVWIPDYVLVHRQSGIEVYLDIVGFWRRSSLERIVSLLPAHGPPRYVLAVSDKLKVDESALDALACPILPFREIPNALELAGLLARFVPERD